MAASAERVRKVMRWKRAEREVARREHLHLVSRVEAQEAECARAEASVAEVAEWTAQAEAAADRAFFERYEEALRRRLGRDLAGLGKLREESERSRDAVAGRHRELARFERVEARITARAREEERRAEWAEQDEVELARVRGREGR